MTSLLKLSANSFIGILSRWLVPGAADDDWGNVHWLGDGAWAVGDGEGGGLVILSAACSKWLWIVELRNLTHQALGYCAEKLCLRANPQLVLFERTSVMV